MLSETSQTGRSGGAVFVRRLLFSRPSQGRGIGIGAGAALAILVLLAMRVWPEYPLEILLLLPVVVVGWYGGKVAGQVAALVLAAGAAAVAYMSGSVQAAIVAAMAVGCVLWLAGSVMPGLRFSAQSYREHAQTDPLTNLGNRRFFREVATVELNRSKRYKRAVSLVYLEAEGFERVMHEAGHAESDALLVQLASVMTGTLRASDVVARISGAEFAVLLPETTGPGACVVADKLRERMVAAAAAMGHRLTFRAAIVGFSDGPVSLDPMLVQADQAMLESRRSGESGSTYREYVHPRVELV